jgi:hypothetical protein
MPWTVVVSAERPIFWSFLHVSWDAERDDPGLTRAKSLEMGQLGQKIRAADPAI